MGERSRTALALVACLAFSFGCTSGPGANVQPNNAPTPQTHTWFPIATGPHAVACNTCHGAYSSFAQFSCFSCHAHDEAPTDTGHTGVNGYTYTSQGCYSCHPTGTAQISNHDLIFPISTGSHAGNQCSACHQASSTGDYSQYQCTTCHQQPATDAFHPGITGYQYSSTACLSCHPNDTIPNFNHSWFPITTGSHASMACASCHTTPGDFTQAQCTTCHSAAGAGGDPAPMHTGVPNYADTTAACLSCHPNDTVSIDHSPYFPITATDTHGTLGCGTCHSDPTNQKNVDCLSTCHQSATNDPKHVNVGGYLSATSGCLLCHADSQVQTVVSHLPFAIQPATPHFQQSCLTCHPTLRTDKTFGEDFTKWTCLGCHSATGSAGDPNTQHTGVAGYVDADAQCIACHPDGSFNHTGFPIGTASHPALPCTNCHTDPSNPTNIAGLKCGTCHLSRDASIVTKHTTNTSNPSITVASSEISTSNSATCVRCHADDQVNLTSQHPSGSSGDPPHHGGVCLECHDSMRTDKTWAADFTANYPCGGGSAEPHGCSNCHNPCGGG